MVINSRKNKLFNWLHSRYALIAIILLLSALIFWWLESKNSINIFGGTNSPEIIQVEPLQDETEVPNDKAEPNETNKTDASDDTNKTKKNPDNAAPSVTNTQELIPPSGTFVSNHRPNLDGSPAPSKVQSVCNTSPGAACYIEFKGPGGIKKLPTRTAGDDGSTIWTWDIKVAGFSEGAWTVTAVASLNGRTKNTTDPIKFEVEP